MSGDELHIDISDDGKSALIRKSLTRLDAEVPAVMQADIDAELAVNIEAARSTLRDMPTHGDKSTGLRDRIAEGVTEIPQPVVTDHPMGLVNTFVDRPNEISIPRGIESIKGWRHPVFGRRTDKWMDQAPQYHWFTAPMEAAEAGLITRFTKTLDLAAEGVARA